MHIAEEQLAHRENNFDFIRLLAAFLVFLDHSFLLFTGKFMSFDLSRELFSYSSGALGVDIFFCLSGFLVYRSLERAPDVWLYLRSRCLRILPGLAGVILLSILVLGLFFSTRDFKSYITSPETHLYLQNILIYRSYYYLPGVFEGNVFNAAVNGSLWSIPYEFSCYLLLPVFFLFKRYSRYMLPLVLIVLFVCYGIWEQQMNTFVVPGLGIVMGSFILPALFFLSGSCFYLWRDKIGFHGWGIGLCLFTLAATHSQLLDRRFLVFVLPYLLFAFAFSKRVKLGNFGKYGDFSYGFYLYAFPVQQAVSALWRKEMHVSGLITASFILALLFAVFSWYVIEKPALRLKYKAAFQG